MRANEVAIDERVSESSASRFRLEYLVLQTPGMIPLLYHSRCGLAAGPTEQGDAQIVCL